MKVLITDAEYPDLHALEVPPLQEAGFTVAIAQCRSEQDVIVAGQDAHALITQYAPITRHVLEALPQIRLVSRYGVGVDTVDLQAAQELGVWVANVPDYGVEEVASHALAMILALLRHLPWLDADVRRGIWQYQSSGPLHRLSTRTLGVVGLGRIGRQLATFAQPLFGSIIGYDPYLPVAAWPDFVQHEDDLPALLARSHVVSLHLPLLAETRNLVDEDFLSHMPVGSYLVNVSRGGLIDLAALQGALDSGHLAGAALDVLPQEPPPPELPILQHPRLLLSPHAAWYSEQAGLELRRKAALNVINWAQEGRPLYVVVQGRST